MPRILVIRFSSIGDILLTSPVVRALNKQLGAEVHFLTKAKFHQLVKFNPHIQQVHFLTDSLSAIIGELQGFNFDYVVDLHKNYRSRMVIRALKAPHFSFDKLNLEKWLMVNLNINRLSGQHLVDRYFQGLSGLGVQPDKEGLEFFFEEEFSTLPEIIELPDKYFALALGAAHPTKQMPESLIRKIITSLPGKIALLGGQQEISLGEVLEESYPDKVINCAGKTSLLQSARVIQACQVIITPDTGMMHMAVALKKPVVVVWGNTIPDFGMFPYYPGHPEKFVNVEVPGLNCRPCSKLGKTSCPKGHFDCMNKIEVMEITQAVNTLINLPAQ
ncbi:MAG: glycosyltransferase family 9 protein [Saprospiraceae bacterium]|nr:glycosyltransferase family 9 protein [Saprospiraceae bacterium]